MQISLSVANCELANIASVLIHHSWAKESRSPFPQEGPLKRKSICSSCRDSIRESVDVANDISKIGITVSTLEKKFKAAEVGVVSQVNGGGLTL
jgi:hypothetical protein